MHVLFVCTDNGLGHVKRSLEAANQISSNDIKVSIVAPISSCQVFDFDKSIQVYDFSISPTNYYHKYTTITRNLLDLIAYVPRVDLIVFDNLPFYQLSDTYDTLLFSNFYWHYVIDSFSNTLGAREFDKSLGSIQNHLATSVFCMNHASKAQKLLTTYPFQNSSRELPKKKAYHQPSILLSFGLSDRLTTDLCRISNFCKKNAHCNVFLEPRFFSAFHGQHPPNCRMAGYTSDFYSLYNIAIIRPGLGTSIELIRHNIPSYSVYESSNDEMRHNASILRKLSPINTSFESLDAALNEQINIPQGIGMSQLDTYTRLADSLTPYPTLISRLIHDQ